MEAYFMEKQCKGEQRLSSIVDQQQKWPAAPQRHSLVQLWYRLLLGFRCHYLKGLPKTLGIPPKPWATESRGSSEFLALHISSLKLPNILQNTTKRGVCCTPNPALDPPLTASTFLQAMYAPVPIAAVAPKKICFYQFFRQSHDTNGINLQPRWYWRQGQASTRPEQGEDDTYITYTLTP